MNYYIVILKIIKPLSLKIKFFNDYGAYKGSASNHDEVIDNVISHFKRQKKY